MLQTALHFSHTLLQEILQPGDHVVDATMGNGHDTVFLAEHIGKLVMSIVLISSNKQSMLLVKG